jgi:oligopeptide/dipeptide ABC transporter ATP-binding protein
MTPLLEVRDLHVSYTAQSGDNSAAIAGVSFAIAAGETLGVLGESGSGKSTLASALLQVLPANGKIEKGAVHFEGQDILLAKPSELRKIRGERVALIFQEPSQALHPGIRIEEQIGDVIAAHKGLDRRTRRRKAREILSVVLPVDTERIAKSYPHQLSGGQRGRVLIAQAISCEPSLIVADEPTASLDAETQREILSLFRTLRQQFKLALLWITHNPALLADFADRVMVLYAGRVAELGPTAKVLSAPQHPYTEALLRCLPPTVGKGLANRKTKLPVISGEGSVSIRGAGGCLFEPRCNERMELCTKREPDMVRLSSTHEASCFKHVG